MESAWECPKWLSLNFVVTAKKQALLGALAAKAVNARLLDAATIVTSVLIQLTIMIDAYLVDLFALKEVVTDRQTD